MKAVCIRRVGGPEVLEFVDLPLPAVGPNDVLVRNLAIGVGMPDIMVRRGIYAWMPRLPAVIGIESAGVIEAVGCDVAGRHVGQRVYCNARDLPERSGGYAEFRVLPAEAAHPLEDGVDLAQAAALGNYQVAESLLRVAQPAAETRTLAVLGAAGGVGTAVVQLAVLNGLRVIGVAGSEEKCELVLRQGAAAVVNHRREEIAEGILRCTGGAGADVILDPVGGETLARLFSALAPLGLVVSFGGLGGEPHPDTLQAMRQRFGDSPGLRMFSMHTWDRRPAIRRRITQHLIGLLAAGRIDPLIDQRMPMLQAAAAHQRFEQGLHRGKIILLPAADR